MIKRILINKSPTFSYLELYVNKGFNVISGTSGSGKSVFFHSILSAFGLREPNAELIEINLQINFDDFNINLEDIGISNNIIESNNDESTISILKKQNTRYFLNHQSMPKKKINEISQNFIKYISTKDSKELDSNNMLDVLDHIITKDDKKFIQIKNQFKKFFNDFKITQNALNEVEEKQKNIQNLKEFAEFEIDKITKINPIVGEYEKLMRDKKILSKKEKILELSHLAQQELENLQNVNKFFDALDLDSSFLNDAIFEAKDKIENSLHDFNNINFDADELLDRISIISDLNRRYGSEQNALNHLQKQKQNLEQYNNIEFDKEQLESKLKILNTQLNDLKNEITSFREKYLQEFEDNINHFAGLLKLKNVELTLQETSINDNGADMLDITLNNVSKNLISSGQYNRLRLSMLCVLAQVVNQFQGILILDEIDANLSGEESEGVAKLLKFLSKNYQVFAISHQPFMPLLGDYHYLVSIDEKHKGSMTLLDFNGRVKEIARMISGGRNDKDAIEYATSKLKQNLQND